MDAEELRLKFVAEDAVSAIASKVGGAVEGLMSKLRVQATTQASVGAQADAIAAKRAVADLAAAQRAQEYMGVTAKMADVERARAAAQEAAAKGSQDASMLEIRAMTAEQDAEVARLGWTKRMADEAVSAREREAAASEAAFGRIRQAAGALLGGLQAVAGVALAVGAGAAVAGVALAAGLGDAANAATNFDSQMMLVRTQAHDTTDDLHQLGQSVLDLAPTVGVGPEALAQGLYHVTSVGYRGAEALDILKVAAEGAKVGQANLDDTAYALTSTMTTFGIKGEQAASTMATLNAIVGAGDMHFQDLNAAISTGFFAAGETFGVSIQSMGAALAYLTDRGASADESATRLKMSITLLGAPTKQSAGILKDLGLTQDEVTQRTSAMEEALKRSGVTTTQLSEDLRSPDGIQVALQDLVDHMTAAGLSSDETAAVLARAFGGGRSGAAIMSMVQHLDTLKSKFDAINQGQSRFGADLGDTMGTVKSQVQQVEAGFDSWRIEIGEKVMPLVAMFMGFVVSHAPDLEHLASAFVDRLVPAVQRFVAWVQSAAKTIQPFATETLGNLRQAIDNSRSSFDAFGTDFHDLSGEMSAAVKSEGFAEFVAAMTVLVPAGIEVAIAALVVMVDQLKITGTALLGIAKVAIDVSRGDWKAAWSDMADTVRLENQDMIQQATDAEGLQKAIAHATSSDVSAEYEGMKNRVLDATNGMHQEQLQQTYAQRAAMRNAAHDIGQDYDVYMAGAMHDNAADVKGEAQQTVQEAIQAANQTAATATTTGAFLAQGIALGLTDNQGFISDAAIAATRNAMHEAQQNAIIQSPSRLWADEIGRPLALGIAMGIVDEQDTVAAAAASLVNPPPWFSVTLGSIRPIRAPGPTPAPQGTPVQLENHTHLYLDGRMIETLVQRVLDQRLAGLMVATQ